MEQLGIQPFQLLAQTINFVIMVVLLTKLLYKPVLKVLDERKKKIEEGLSYTEKMKKDMEKAQVKEEAMLKKAREQAKAIIDEAKRSAKSVEAELVADAHTEVENMKQRAKAEIEVERQDLIREVKVQAVELASAIAAKVIVESLNDASQKKILDKKISSLAKYIGKS